MSYKYAATRKRVNKARDDNFKTIVRKVKAAPCMDCKVIYPFYVMDLDHVRGTKRANVSKMSTWNVDRILEEIAKCDVVCSNCHRQRTHDRKARLVQC